MRSHILAVCTMFGAFCIFSPREIQAQQRVGYVLDVEGCWAPTSNPPCLKSGESIGAGTLLRNASAKPTDGERIVIADLKGEVIKTIRCKSSICNECRGSGTCYDPIQPLPESSSPGLLQTAFEGLMALFSAKPERFSVHRVRGATLSDAVAQVSGENVYLSQVLTALGNEHYNVVFTQITDDGDISKWKSRAVPIAGEHPNIDQFVVKGIHPGLYEVRLNAAYLSQSSWVLLTDPESFAKLNSEFLRFSSQMETWGEDVLPGLKDSYRRAYLVYLDQQIRAQNAKRVP